MTQIYNEKIVGKIYGVEINTLSFNVRTHVVLFRVYILHLLFGVIMTAIGRTGEIIQYRMAVDF